MVALQEIILASASPRRKKLLEQIGLKFRVIPSRVEEIPEPGLEKRELVLRLANLKAGYVAGLYPWAIVLGADTIVCCEGQILGKPRDRDDAARMLRLLSGRIHEVITGLVLRQESRGLVRTEAVTTLVRFRDLSQREIDGYIATGEPFDKAGAYGIQGYGALLVESINGCYFNVVGLPLSRLAAMFRDFGVELLCPNLNTV
ncbi:septum formation protein Maf [Thermacetogenium phaeum DSM 12270]|uniref:dTTP/UTP pyrophosphatase n=1 Tax=Thermacetogenium phaeum (strain ATCC BAA-254 / DSM 26808 / PB) TaxID=1089553 RepID=K4LFJ2_THEPS|nr:Maf family protein [Thermacetogenium phaeum]AFV10832.1 septum formation protein Maf [Thermacetogenium phaeum DSM 12270]